MLLNGPQGRAAVLRGRLACFFLILGHGTQRRPPILLLLGLLGPEADHPQHHGRHRRALVARRRLLGRSGAAAAPGAVCAARRGVSGAERAVAHLTCATLGATLRASSSAAPIAGAVRTAAVLSEPPNC